MWLRLSKQDCIAEWGNGLYWKTNRIQRVQYSTMPWYALKISFTIILKNVKARLGSKPWANMSIHNCYFATEICPNDHPYVYENGEKCCNYYFDTKFDTLNISSTSCWNNDTVPCPFGICRGNLILRSLNVAIMVV